MAFRKKHKLSKKEAKALKKVGEVNPVIIQEPTTEKEKVLKPIIIPEIITVRDLAKRMDLPVTEVISALIKNGIMATINESIDFATAEIICDDLGFTAKSENKAVAAIDSKENEQDTKDLKPRPPVVVVMGHVDHGKTTLLDYIRKANVTASEAGGITQHIGAYQVEVKDNNKKSKLVTFLDTPGHEAFSAMRAHGANITDIAILVIAADDGVKPQTKEAISHAKAAGIPIIVAINKIDKPGADTEKAKRELGDLDLIPEEWGGDTIMVPISAKTGQGVDKLLEMLLVVAEVEDLKARAEGPAKGVVIESDQKKGLGTVATILVQSGTLHKQDQIIIGSFWCKIKLMKNDRNEIVDQVLPAAPAQIVGMKESVKFGEKFFVANSAEIAKLKNTSVNTKESKVLSLGQISQKIKSGELKELNLILKTDTQGSMEAIKDSLANLSTQEAAIKIIHQGVGNISESDVNLAISTDALVIGFNVNVLPSARTLADDRNIKISIYNIIYNLIDDLTSGLSGMLEPEIVETTTGRLKILKVFKEKKDSKIIGGKVTSGIINKSDKIKVYRDKELIGQGKIETLEQNKKGVSNVTEGFECGMGIKFTAPIAEGDVIESFKEEEKTRKLQ